MQLHEAGVGPEEAGAGPGPSPPLQPAQVMIPLFLPWGWASRPLGDYITATIRC